MGNSQSNKIKNSVYKNILTEEMSDTLPFNNFNNDAQNLIDLLRNKDTTVRNEATFNLIGGGIFNDTITNNNSENNNSENNYSEHQVSEKDFTVSNSSPFMSENMYKYLTLQKGGAIEGEESSTSQTSDSVKNKHSPVSESISKSISEKLNNKNFNSYMSSSANSVNSDSYENTTISDVRQTIPDSVNTSDIDMISIH
jgi:hypothetical protein